MTKNENTNTNTNATENATELALVIASLSKKLRSKTHLKKSDYQVLFAYIEKARQAFIARHIALENGKNISEFNNTCYDAMRKIFAEIGIINGYKLTADIDGVKGRNLFDDFILYLRKDKNASISPEHASIISQISDTRKSLKNAILDTDKQPLIDRLDELKAKKQALENATNNAITLDIFTNENTYAKNILYSLSKAINGQLTKSPDEIASERKAKNDERKAKRNATKNTQKADK